ncbi:MAG TPA: DUF2911 domain-containing protein [Gemmatimonadaceae bacterium]
MMPATPTTISARAAAVLALTTLCAGAALAQGADQGAFLVRLGNDTVAVERFTRTPTTLDGVNLLRIPQTVVRHYTATFDARGYLTRYEVSVRGAAQPADAPPMQHALLTFRGDSAVVELHADSSRTVAVKAGPELLPLMNLGYASWETALLRARRTGADSVSIPMLFLGSPETSVVTIKRLGRDSVLMTTPFGDSRLAVDGSWHLLGLASPGSTQQVTVQRLRTVDIDALTRAFASRGMGMPSPRDTARAAFGDARVTVDYGRPSKRGRVIFGSVVPWNVVWRTGANAATTLVTDRDLEIGGTRVPSGTYTLFSLPSPDGWKLIVSRKTGEWGTEYDSTADLARIDMQVTTIPTPVEQFTITLEPGGEGGTLALAWDRTRASVPVRVVVSQ